MNSLIVTVLGCGTSSGVPLIGCSCRVCRSRDPKNNRLRASIWIQTHKKSLLVDTSTDLRQQALTHKITRVDAVLFTHPHSDHIGGIDELRGFNFVQKARIPLYGNEWTRAELKSRYAYIFDGIPYEGGGIPELDFNLVDASQNSFRAAGIAITPIEAAHGSKTVFGFRIGGFAYLTDCSYIPEKSLGRLEGLDALVLDCVREGPHPTHLNLDQALAVIGTLKPRRAFLTHMGHDFDYKTLVRRLPKNVLPAFDGLKIRVRNGIQSTERVTEKVTQKGKRP